MVIHLQLKVTSDNSVLSEVILNNIIAQSAQIVNHSTAKNIYFYWKIYQKNAGCYGQKTKGYALAVNIGEHIPFIYPVIPGFPSSVSRRL